VLLVIKSPSRQEVDLHASGFVAAQAEPIIAQSDLQGITQGGEGEDFKLLSFEEAHLHEPLHERVLSLDGRDSTALTWP
jgi:hypothetical protein